MSTTSPSSPPKRPRLSLQIKALANGPSGRTSRCLAAAVDVKSPTAFNTLSNVYATAVDRSTPVHENPPTAILSRRPVLSLQTHDAVAKDRSAHSTPYLGPYLDTPITAQPISPAVVKDICFPSAAMTATPPLSAQPPEQNAAQVFTFEGTVTAAAVSTQGAKAPASAAQNAKRRTTMPAGTAKLPYTHPRCLRSILRNSPLPPLSTKSPESPRRQSLRLQEKAARRVAYNSPLTQTITTSKYTKSHIDLLAEDATPVSPSASSSDDGDNVLDQAMADVGSDSTRDGGQTPGPFEEMRRRMANMQASTPLALSPTGGGIRKRGCKRREKKRRWVWTIGQDDEPDEGCESAVTPAAATERKDSAPSASSVPASVSVPVLAVPAPRPRTRNQQAQLARAFAAAMQVQAPTQVPVLAVPVPPLRATSPPATARPCSPAPPPALRTQPQPQPQPQSRPRAQSQSTTRPPTRELTPIPAFLLPDAPDSGRRRSYSSPEPSTTTTTTTTIAAGAFGIIRPLTPEQHLTMSMSMPMCMSPTSAEPPTPSVESTAGSVASSVFETAGPGTRGPGTGGGDVEMSDASSVVCESDDDAADEMDGAVDGGRGWRYRGCRYGGYDGYGDGGARFGYNIRRLDDDGGCGAGAGAGAGGDGDVEMDEGTPTMTARPVGVRGWAPWDLVT